MKLEFFVMKFMKKYLVLIMIIFLNTGAVLADKNAIQTVQAELPEILHIEKIIVEGTEYEKDDILTNIDIKSVEPVSETCYRLNLSPFTIRIHTNLAEPIQVSAKFEECCSTCGRYPMKNEDLSVTPSSYTIQNPHDKIETDFFTPQVLAHEGTVCTTYNAKLIITLGRV